MNGDFFDIAHYTGHKALDELYNAYLIYILPISEALRFFNIHIQFYDTKSESDITEIISKISVSNLKIESVDPVNAIHINHCLTHLRKKELEFCVNTAIFFQVMMESVIIDSLSSNQKKKSFYEKWENYFDKNQASEEERVYFKTYLENVYNKMRVPVVHPKTRQGIKDEHLFRFPILLENIKYGWFAYIFFLNKSEGSNLNYEENWKIMSENIHKIPTEIDNRYFPDINQLSRKLYEIAKDFFDKKL